MDLITVSSRGQIVIPEAVRKRLGLEKGSRLVLQVKDDVIWLFDAKKVERLISMHHEHVLHEVNKQHSER